MHCTHSLDVEGAERSGESITYDILKDMSNEIVVKLFSTTHSFPLHTKIGIGTAGGAAVCCKQQNMTHLKRHASPHLSLHLTPLPAVYTLPQNSPPMTDDASSLCIINLGAAPASA